MIKSDRSEWSHVRFGDVVVNTNETVKDAGAAGLTRVVALEHVAPGSLRLTGWQEAADGTTFTRRFRKGQTLFAKRRAYQRKVAFADFDGVCSGDLLAFEAKPELLLPELLPFIVRSDSFFDYALRTSAGSLSPRTKWQDLANWEFELPPISEQRRIADFAWSIEAARIAQLDLVDNLELTARTWLSLETRIGGMPSARLDAAAEVVGGRQRSPRHANGPRMRRYLRVANIKDDAIDYTDVNEMDFSEKESQKYRLQDGDILMSEGQSRELVGQSAIYHERAGDDLHFQNTLVRVRCGPSVLPEYLQQVFRLYLQRGDFAAVAKQTTSIAHLGVSRLAAMHFPLPPLDVQSRIVERYREYEVAIKCARSAAVSSTALARALSREVM